MTTFDTLRTVKRLRGAGASEELAEAVTEALRESRDSDLAQLATKADLAVLKGEIQREIADAKTDMLKWVVGLLLAQTGIIAALVKLL